MKQSVLKRLIAVLLVCTVVFSCSLIQSFAAETEEMAYKNELMESGFPELYLDKLWEMHQTYPNWKFEAYDTGLDWDTAVANESVEKKNLVYIEPDSGWCATRLYRSQSVGSYTSKQGFDYDYVIRDGSDANQKGWIDATPMAVAYYMNPYTFIGNEITIMQYESLEWNMGSSITAAEAKIEPMLTGTFMSKTRNSYNTNYVDDDGNITYKNTSGQTVTASQTFANAICTAAYENNINPYYLTAKILGEVGTGGSGSTTGTYSGYAGYYNYLNIGANDSGSGGAVANGLKKAKEKGWNSPMASIVGGAEFLASSYIGKGQNTAYFQKFNVTKTNTYNNQYMTAVNGVVNTTYKTYSGYKTNNILSEERTFIIPVFNNMPDGSSNTITLSGYPNTASTNASVKIRENAGIDYEYITTIAAGTSVTNYGGYRDQRVAYSSQYGTDSTYYRMMCPLWYKIGTSKYLCEDYVDVDASKTLAVNDTFTLKYKLDTGTEKPRFMVQDTRIATVDLNGNIKAVSEGTTKVVAYLVNGSFAVLNLTVTLDLSGVPTKISSSTYSVNNTSSFVSKVPAGTTVSTFTSKINEGEYIKVTKDGKTITGDDVLSTGCLVSIMNGNSVVKNYTIIVTGDININNKAADGKISITDLLAIRDELLSNQGVLTGANYKAADTNGDGKISISDLLEIRDHLLGTSKISPLAY